MRRLVCTITLSFAALAGAALPAHAADPGTAATIQHVICRMVDRAAAHNGLPTGFLARLIWQESRLHPTAVSPKGAEGVAQFMPQTASERGLADPLDPEQAVDHAARLLVDLKTRFGNLGLAAAAYNAGPGRVAKWLAGEAGLPSETRTYVAAVTGREAEDWAAYGRIEIAPDPEPCISVTARLAQARITRGGVQAAPAVWQARLDGTLAKAIEGLSILASRSRNAAATTATRRSSTAESVAAQQLCDSLRALGANCAVYAR